MVSFRGHDLIWWQGRGHRLGHLSSSTLVSLVELDVSRLVSLNPWGCFFVSKPMGCLTPNPFGNTEANLGLGATSSPVGPL